MIYSADIAGQVLLHAVRRCSLDERTSLPGVNRMRSISRWIRLEKYICRGFLTCPALQSRLKRGGLGHASMAASTACRKAGEHAEQSSTHVLQFWIDAEVRGTVVAVGRAVGVVQTGNVLGVGLVDKNVRLRQGGVMHRVINLAARRQLPRGGGVRPHGGCRGLGKAV